MMSKNKWWEGLTPLGTAAALLRQTAQRLRNGQWREGGWGTGDYRCVMGWLEAEMAFQQQQVGLVDPKLEFFGYTPESEDYDGYADGSVTVDQPYPTLSSAPEALQRATAVMGDILCEEMPEFVASSQGLDRPLTADEFAALTIGEKVELLIGWNDSGYAKTKAWSWRLQSPDDVVMTAEERGRQACISLYEKAAARLEEIVE